MFRNNTDVNLSSMSMFSPPSPSKNIKNDLDQDRRRRLFESKLALLSLSNNNNFPVIHEIARLVIEQITSRREEAKAIVEKNLKTAPKKLNGELYDENVLGHLPGFKDKPDDILDDIITYLKNPEIPLIQKIPTLGSIGYGLMQPLFPVCGKEKPALKDSIGKISCKNALVPYPTWEASSYYGIVKHAEDCENVLGFAKQLGFAKNTWKRAIDRHRIDLEKYESFFMEAYQTLDIAATSGTSEHTMNFLLFVRALGIEGNDLREALEAYTKYLVVSGSHSDAEAKRAAELFGIHYEHDNYMDFIPDSVKEAEQFKDLQKDFPEFFPKPLLQNKM